MYASNQSARHAAPSAAADYGSSAYAEAAAESYRAPVPGRQQQQQYAYQQQQYAYQQHRGPPQQHQQQLHHPPQYGGAGGGSLSHSRSAGHAPAAAGPAGPAHAPPAAPAQQQHRVRAREPQADLEGFPLIRLDQIPLLVDNMLWRAHDELNALLDSMRQVRD